MKTSVKLSMRLGMGMGLAAFAVPALANELPPPATNNAIDKAVVTFDPLANPVARPVTDPIEIAVPTSLPSETATEHEMTKEDFLHYLSEHQEELEATIAELIRMGNVGGLKELLPIYQNMSNRDDSLIEWAEALIKKSAGDHKSAIATLRKLNAQFPDVRVLRFQLAAMLLENRQFAAARSELEKIASLKELPEADRQLIDRMIAVAKSSSDWSLNANINYTKDNNINNTPELGTKLGENWTYSTPREKGEGVDYALSANKRWIGDNRFFTGIDLDGFGTYYWDNKKHNTLNAKVGVEAGYVDGIKEFSIKPFYQKNWYGGGSNAKTDKLAAYRDSYGVQLGMNYAIGRNTQYYANASYTENKHTERKSNNGKDYSLGQTVAYTVNPKTYFFGGVDYFKRNAVSNDNSFHRQGVRVGWGQIWGKGFSTRASVGYGIRQYDAPDFFKIKRKNEELNFNMSIWNRGFSLLGLTPRVNLSYNKVKSNSAFEEYSKGDASVEFTKTF